MTEQANHSNNNNNSNNNNRRNNNRRRHHHNRGPGGNNNQNAPKEARAPREPKREPRSEQGSQAHSGHNNNNRRRPHHNNRPRVPQQNNPTAQIDRLYEKYLNLLDQHLIARRKYHDLFYRAEGAQKAKLEKNFYGSLDELRNFEERMTPEMKELFEKRNNGYAPDNIYSSNHELSREGDSVDPQMKIEDPHYLQSQEMANYSEDKEESTGSIEDYLRYKGL